MLRLCLSFVVIIAILGQGFNFAIASGQMPEQSGSNHHEIGIEVTIEKDLKNALEPDESVDDCCDVDCCDGPCVCPANTCVSGLFIDISTSLPSLPLCQTFALASLHSPSKVHICTRYRPPIRLLV